MAPKHDILADIAGSDGQITVDPHWILAVVRFRDWVSYDRTKTSQGDRSRNPSDNASVAERPILIIYGDCTSLTVTHNKANHIGNMQAQLRKGQAEYMGEIMPGDWVIAWMVNDSNKAYELIERIKERRRCNRFDDGLKFVGRVDALREIDSRDRSTGKPTYTYSLTALSFTEMDSKIFYDPRLTLNESFGQQMARLGKAVMEVSYTTHSATADKGALDINKILPFFVDLLLGEGPPQTSKDPGGNGHDRTPNDAFMVPASVAGLLGRNLGGVVNYAEVIDKLIGTQHYSDSFQPSLMPLLGEFVHTIPALNNIPVWGLLQQFQNPAVNEMYTCLRGDPDGNVVPTLIVRQLPFTNTRPSASTEYEDAWLHTGIDRPTRFLELPRWQVDPALVWDANLGRSNAMRFNFIQVTGVAPGVDPRNIPRVYQANKPVRDDADIKRSGLRPYMMSVNCSVRRAELGTPEWTEFAADFLMGQHLTLSGSLALVGVQAPICPGDNLEYRGVVYHIEAVTHTAGTDPTGKKFFETSLLLSHGMAGEEMISQAVQQGVEPHDAIYAYVGRRDPANRHVTAETDQDLALKGAVAEYRDPSRGEA